LQDVIRPLLREYELDGDDDFVNLAVITSDLPSPPNHALRAGKKLA